MKGIVFTEFLEMVEEGFGLEVLDKVTSVPSLSTGGAYTAVGNYPHGEMLAMLDELNKIVGLPHEDLVFTFGRSLLRTFSKGHSAFFSNADNSIEFLKGIETVIHSEVRKLYSDAVLPSFECEQPDKGTLIMHYRSKRPFADLAHGLIHETIIYYKDLVDVHREAGPTGDSHSGKFTLTMRS